MQESLHKNAGGNACLTKIVCLQSDLVYFRDTLKRNIKGEKP